MLKDMDPPVTSGFELLNDASRLPVRAFTTNTARPIVSAAVVGRLSWFGS